MKQGPNVCIVQITSNQYCYTHGRTVDKFNMENSLDLLKHY